MSLIKEYTSETRIQVRYAETDQMGIVYHANYLIWFNIALEKMMSNLGFSIQMGEKKGFYFPVVEVNLKYHQPAKYGDELIVKATPEETTVARFTTHFQVIRVKRKKLLAEGSTTCVLTDATHGALIRIPSEFETVAQCLMPKTRGGEKE